METAGQLYYDPFAAAGEELFDPEGSYAAIEQRYRSGAIRHQDAADTFVRDSEALMLDAWFVGRLDAVAAIAGRLHQSCAGDGHLAQALQGSEVLAGIGSGQQAADGHHHGDSAAAAGPEPGPDDDDDDTDPRTGKRAKRKPRRGWFGVYR